LFLCTNIKGTKGIQFIDIPIKPVLKMISPVASLRFYVIFKKPDMIGSTIISNKGFKWCIPTGRKSAMITYTDGALATRFNNLEEKMSLKIILKDLSEILGYKISPGDIVKTYFAYWREAFSIIKGEVSVEEYEKNIENLPKGFRQTVVPLDFGINQAWMEASLMKI
jgi:hypothetical protein